MSDEHQWGEAGSMPCAYTRLDETDEPHRATRFVIYEAKQYQLVLPVCDDEWHLNAVGIHDWERQSDD